MRLFNNAFLFFKMNQIGYNHERYPSLPKDELAEILAKNYLNSELQKPENQGKSKDEIYLELHRQYMKLPKKTLYGILYKSKKIKVSRLENKVKDLQSSLF